MVSNEQRATSDKQRPTIPDPGTAFHFKAGSTIPPSFLADFAAWGVKVFAEWRAIEYSLPMPIRQETCDLKMMPLSPSNRSFLLPPLCALIVFGLVAFGSTVAAGAQEKPSAQTPASPQTTTPPSDRTPNAPSKVPGAGLYNLLQEKSIVFPDIALTTTPLSPGQKFQLAVDNSISVHTITWAMLGSAIGQADNSPTGFGQGWDAYAKRFGSSMGRQASSEVFGTFILASALHEDPRFYPEVNPTFFHAVKYSAQRLFVTRNDSGRDVMNWSGLAGPAMAEGLATVYWPDRNRTVGDTLLRYGLDLATRAGGNMLREYWPVFYGKIHRSSRPATGH